VTGMEMVEGAAEGEGVDGVVVWGGGVGEEGGVGAMDGGEAMDAEEDLDEQLVPGLLVVLCQHVHPAQ